MLKKKHILVTGGAGFLGSHLCKRLLGLDHRVTCLDNYYTGATHNVDDLINNPDFDLIQHDITDPLPENIVVDEIYNLACPASPIHYQRDPVQTIKTNVHGTINVLELAKKLNCKIFQASTSEVYGDPTVHPQSEDYWGNVNPRGPRSCYDEGKRCAESLLFAYHQQHNIAIKVVRIFNTYGPNMHPNDGRVVSNFIMQALEDKDITIYGKGLQTRSFCYVDDLIDGFVKFMALQDDVTGPMNIGNPTETTIAQLASLVIELTGSSSSIINLDLPIDDPTQRCPDIGLAKTLIDFSPETPLRKGLQKTIEYLKTQLPSTTPA